MKKKISKIISITLIFVFIFSLFGIKNAFATEPTFVLENAVINDKSDKVEASIISFNNNELNTNVTFHKVDDFVSYILTIKNTTDKEYQIALINDNNSSNNVEYEYSYDNSVKIQPNKTFNVTLKATYKTSVTDMSKRDQNEGFSLSFTMVDAEGNIISDDIEVNPKTGDNIHFYIIIAVISLTGLILIFVRNKKIKKCLVISLLLTPIVTKAVAPSFVINLNPSLKLYDKVVVVRVINGVEKEEIIDYNSVLEIPEDPNIPGYKFEGWLLDGEVYNFNTPIKEDSKLEAKLTPIEYKIEYDLDDGQVNGTNPTKYTVETNSFDLINPTKSGYVFEGWTGSNIDGLQTRVTVEKGSTGDKSFVAHFSLDEHVSYKVIHKYKKLTDGYEIVEEPLEGAAFSQVTPAFKPKEGFNNPASGQEITILPDTLVTVEYVYERKPITLSLSGDTDKYETSIPEGSYPYGTSVTLTALEQEHYNFVKWSNNSTENPLTITLTDNIDISPVFEAKKYTISFYSHGGVDVDSIQKEYNSEIGTLPGTIKTDYIFDGWYTEEVGGTKVTSTTKVTGAMELHAHWLKSVTLATVSPESVEITKGTTQSLIITNVEEEYTITSNDISVATVEGTTVTGVGAGSTTLTIKGNISKETITVNVVINAIKYDVTFNTHGGVSVNPIKVEENEEIGTLPGTTKTDYIFDGWYTEEVGGTKVTSTTKVTGAMELHAHWLKSVTLATVSPESVEITKGTTQSLTITNIEEEYTITSNDISVATVEGTTVTGVGAGSTTLTIKGNISKETITVNVVINAIEYDVTFNTHGGVSVNPIKVEENEEIGTLPGTTKTDYIFDGWYTEEVGGTKVTSTTKVTGTMELHAHWLKSVTLATVSPESVEITKGTTQSLTITNVEEEYTITSNDISVATVEGTTVTGVGAGSTTLTIKGNISKETKTIDVVINPSEYKVTFNSHGGDSVDYINVTPNTTIENLPITKKSGVFFGGWYTEETDGTKITTNTVITGDIELHAHWNQHLCFPAEVLHKATCSTEGGCLSAGFGNGDTITYGIKPNSLTKLPGFAYDCDINGDGNLDEANERFYYLRTDGDDDVLYYHSGFEGENGKANSEIFVYTLALTKLPTTTQWNNVVKTFDGRAARLPKQADVENACGTTTLTNDGSLNSCYYLFETSRFESKNTGRSAIWLLNENDNYYRLHTKNRRMESKKSEATTSENAVRPTIEVPSIYIKQYTPGTDVHTVSFNAEGGTPVDDVYVDDGAVISPLPTTTRENYDFDGWYTDKTYSTKLTTLTAIVDDITYVAKWIPHVAIVNGKGYTTLSAAVSAVPKNTETTITFINDTTIESTITIPSDRNIVLDIGSYTISSSSGTIFENKGILTINSGTITSTAGSGMINNNSSGTLNINGGTLSATGSRQIVYNTGGTVNIRGNAYLSSKAQEDKRGTVHNVSGTLNITGGTIVSLETNAVKVDAGTVVIGDYNGFYDTNGIIIQGKTNGISTSVSISLYDGILKGISAPINNESRITNKEEGATKVSGTETIGEDTYKTLYYNLETDKYLITFIANGGTVSPTYKLVGIGSMLGELPIPSRGIYNFEGWYTDADDKVTEETVPTDNTTLTAKWSYSSNEDIVNFNTTNDVMKVYYSSIASWASEQSTFQSNMNENFYSHNCSECTGPNYQSCPTPAAGKQLCEQPKGYDTSVNSIKVYESDETTKVKGNEATYVTIVDGTLYNLIPEKTYYWESTTDSNVHGYVKATAKRRTIYSSVRNVRDLGGMEVSFTRDNQTKTGTIKYGKLFRGAQLSGGQKDVDSLLKLGITREIDLRVKTEGTNPVRLPKHDLSDSSTVTNEQDIIVTNYLIYPDTYFENYTKLRNALKATMEYIVNDNDSIYFHCTIGTDRTGTLAYFLEGFLGANREDMIEDYELSYFSGLLNRNRFHDHLDGSSINPRFTTMANTYDTNEKIYNWYMYGLSDEEIEVEDQLIQAFRDAMIDYN